MTNIANAQLVVAFEPTIRHISIRERLRSSVPPHLLYRLGVDTVDQLKSVLPRHLVEEIKKTIECQPEFLDWLVEEDAAQLELLQLKTKAVSTLSRVLDLKSEDSKTIALQLKAAETILGNTKRTRPTLNQTQNIKVTAIPGVPKQLATKTVDELADELKALSGG